MARRRLSRRLLTSREAFPPQPVDARVYRSHRAPPASARTSRPTPRSSIHSASRPASPWPMEWRSLDARRGEHAVADVGVRVLKAAGVDDRLRRTPRRASGGRPIVLGTNCDRQSDSKICASSANDASPQSGRWRSPRSRASRRPRRRARLEKIPRRASRRQHHARGSGERARKSRCFVVKGIRKERFQLCLVSERVSGVSTPAHAAVHVQEDVLLRLVREAPATNGRRGLALWKKRRTGQSAVG